mgnify:CR=1 FL=1
MYILKTVVGAVPFVKIEAFARGGKQFAALYQDETVSNRPYALLVQFKVPDIPNGMKCLLLDNEEETSLGSLCAILCEIEEGMDIRKEAARCCI